MAFIDGTKEERLVNSDVVALASRIRRMMKEVQSGQSADQTPFKTADYNRCIDYLAAHRRLLDHIVSDPELDATESKVLTWKLDIMFQPIDVESEMVMDMQRHIFMAWAELVNSASARQVTGITAPDAGRQYTYIEKMERYLTDFVEPTTPTDYPASTPDDAVGPPPAGGV